MAERSDSDREDTRPGAAKRRRLRTGPPSPAGLLTGNPTDALSAASESRRSRPAGGPAVAPVPTEPPYGQSHLEPGGTPGKARMAGRGVRR